MSDMSEFCTELMHWLDGGRSPWHTVAMAEQALTAQGFTPLELGAPFAVKRGRPLLCEQRHVPRRHHRRRARCVPHRRLAYGLALHAHQAAAGARFRRLLPSER